MHAWCFFLSHQPHPTLKPLPSAIYIHTGFGGTLATADTHTHTHTHTHSVCAFPALPYPTLLYSAYAMVICCGWMPTGKILDYPLPVPESLSLYDKTALQQQEARVSRVVYLLHVPTERQSIEWLEPSQFTPATASSPPRPHLTVGGFSRR